MDSPKYNGWTNFETWKINLEIFDGWSCSPFSAEEAQEMAEMVLIGDNGIDGSSAVASIIRDFLSRVDWLEISHAYEENEELV